jgi:hypothetical protein
VKREQEFYRRQDVQACRVCGRLFVRRKGDVCSMSCKEKAEADD